MTAPKPQSWNAATLYHLRQRIHIDQIVNLPEWKEPTEGRAMSMGLLDLQPHSIVPVLAAPLGNAGIWFRLRISERKASKSEIDIQVAERITEAKAHGDEPSKKEIAEIKQDVKLELILDAQPHHQVVDVMLRDDWLLVTSASVKICDAVTGWLKAKLGDDCKLALVRMDGEKPLFEIGSGILYSDDLIVGNIELGDKIKIVMADETEIATTKMVSPNSQLRGLLKGAANIQSMEIHWGGWTCTLKDGFALSGIVDNHKPGEVIGESEGSDPDDKEYLAHMESVARAEMFVTSVPRIIKDLATHCAGLMELEPEGEQTGLELGEVA